MNEIGGFVRAVRAAEGRGELSKQQRRTLEGQAKGGDLAGAYRGLERLYVRAERVEQNRRSCYGARGVIS